MNCMNNGAILTDRKPDSVLFRSSSYQKLFRICMLNATDRAIGRRFIQGRSGTVRAKTFEVIEMTGFDGFDLSKRSLQPALKPAAD